MFQNNPLLYYVTYALGLQPALTQTTEKEQKCLEQHAAGKRVLVEIGVWHGVNTRRLRKVMHQDARLYAVDPFPAGRFGIQWEKKIAIHEARSEGNGSIHFLELLSEDAAVKFDRIEKMPIDFLFVDGDHSYEAVQKDWSLWAGKIAPGGVVALHDSHPYEGRAIEHVGAAKFTKDVVLRDPRFRAIETCDSLTVMGRLSQH